MRALSPKSPWIISVLALSVLGLGILIANLTFGPVSGGLDVIKILKDISTHEDLPSPVVQYIEVTDGCDPYFQGACATVRSAPTTTASVQAKLRSGIVFAVATSTVPDATGREWYKIVFNEWVRYPERIHGDWYIASDVVESLSNVSNEQLSADSVSTTTKRILIDRSEQVLYAYDGDALFLQTSVSTGLDLTPTPRGAFTVYQKTPSRYMQGPLPGISDQYYDLPGVPWNLYFTNEGGAIHGAYWHTMFGKQWSHGCVNLPLDVAKRLYEWTPLGTPVLVQD